MTIYDTTITVRVRAKSEKAVGKIITNVEHAIRGAVGGHLEEQDDGALISTTWKETP